MVVSQSQLDISNKSYINKDFADVYTELLTYAEKLSYRFSPVSSNETDPFIIMLKLAAFVCDKVNYNIDKNILERFMSSCTQETSMRELSSMLGYYMHYYRSATTDVIFKHATTDVSIDVPRFSTITTQNDVQFLTLTDAVIDAKTRQSAPITAIQGKLKTLSILGNSLIEIDNLDLNNRVYFPESPVAENGIFITSDIEINDWTRVDNLNEQEYLSPIFYFGYDSSTRLPYVEFPEWINKIIGSGLSIKYLVTDGYSGNVAARSFIGVSRASKEDEIDDAEISAINLSAASNGTDPETIEESYSGFKRLVGTLDTLVTCRDYAAKIYDLVSAYGNNLVSNIVVSDRRTDINNGTQLFTIDNFGKCYKNIVAKDENANDILTPHDLCLYPYKPLTSYELGAIPEKNVGGYDDSYKFLGTVGTSAHAVIESALEASKSISHQYKKLSQDDIIAIYIYLKLNAVVTTNVKVSKVESNQIIQKINANLLAEYNARTISLGQEIPFDEIYNTILNSDSRIKAVSLQEPLQYPAIAKLSEINGKHETVIYRSDSTNDAEIYNDSFNFIALKNIVSGHIELFDYDDRFKYEYYSKDNSVYDNVTKITTNAGIKLSRDDKSNSLFKYKYTLGENEAIQLIAPKMNSFISYPYGVLYTLMLNPGVDTKERYIRRGCDYKLQEGEYAIFAYADSNSNWTADIYEGSNNNDTKSNLVIINPNFDMFTTTERLKLETADKKLTGLMLGKDIPGISDNTKEVSFFMLSANDEVQCKKPLTDHLDSTMFCYWLMNDSNNTINWISVNGSTNLYEYILREDEYFYYTDAGSTALVEYGSGTKLVLTSDQSLEEIKKLWTISETLTIENITQAGLNALAEHFMLMNFNSDKPLDIYINEIKTLTSGDTITISYGSYDPEFKTEEHEDVYDVPDNSFLPLKKISIEETVTRLKKDANGNIEYNVKVDAEGNPIYQEDENGEKLKDDNGNYIPVLTDIPIYQNETVSRSIYPEVTYIYDGANLEGDTSSEESSTNLLPDRSSLAEKYQWEIRGLLDLNCGPEQPQYLKNANKITLTKTVLNADGEVSEEIITKEADSDNTLCFRSNVDITINGGDNINLSYIDINTFDTAYPTFNISTLNLTTKNFLNNFDGEFYRINIPQTGSRDEDIKSLTDPDNKYVEFYVPEVSRNQFVGLTIYVPDTNNATTIKLNVPTANMYVSKVCSFNNISGNRKSSTELHTGVNNIIIYSNSETPVSGYFKISAINNHSEAYIQLGKLKLIKGINKTLGLTTTDISTVVHKLFNRSASNFYNKIPNLDRCYLFADLDNAKKIDVSEDYPLISAQGFYDPNNIANAWVMPRIDFQNSIIKLASSSIK